MFLQLTIFFFLVQKNALKYKILDGQSALSNKRPATAAIEASEDKGLRP